MYLQIFLCTKKGKRSFIFENSLNLLQEMIYLPEYSVQSNASLCVYHLHFFFFFFLVVFCLKTRQFRNAVFKVKLNELTMKHALVLIKRIFQHDISSFLCIFFFQTNVSINWHPSGVYVCTCIHVHKNKKAITYRVGVLLT